MSVLPMALLLAVPFWGADPAPSATRSKAQSRQLECTWMSAEAARRERPGQIRDGRPRGDYVERSVVVCAERQMRQGLRSARDEVILSSLESLTKEMATAAASLRPDLADRRWLVEVFYPNAQVAPKIGFATKNSMMSQGLSVSDRTPVLAAGDIDVLLRMPPEQAYPAACSRYTATGSVGDEHALLAIVHRDPLETILHAGICADGRWAWLR
ncbi:MAG: hypothetical protein ACI9MC_002090 [Kiritimatiellia bacterium]|jgi:hypothetical protein